MSSLNRRLTGTTALATCVNMAVLGYTNESVVSRIMKKAEIDKGSAELLFQDMLKFLALTNRTTRLSPTPKIDLAWHEFILHTKDYADFCKNYFGHFIHHEPMSDEDSSNDKSIVGDTIRLASSVFGELSSNWENGMFGATCGQQCGPDIKATCGSQCGPSS